MVIPSKEELPNQLIPSLYSLSSFIPMLLSALKYETWNMSSTLTFGTCYLLPLVVSWSGTDDEGRQKGVNVFHHRDFSAQVVMRIFQETLKTSLYCQEKSNTEEQRLQISFCKPFQFTNQHGFSSTRHLALIWLDKIK